MAFAAAFLPKVFSPSTAALESRSAGANSRPDPPPSAGSYGSRLPGAGLRRAGFSSTPIIRFPPNFVRQLSTKARRNCSNIGVAQIVAASWSNGPASPNTPPPPAVSAIATPAAEEDATAAGISGTAPLEPPVTVESLLTSDGSIAVHAGERSGRGITTDAITTPVVNTSAYWFKNSEELIDFKEGRHASYEYGRYGNPTTRVLEEKMSALERAESTLFVSSGMYASVAMMMSLVPPGGHIITTTDCYRKTRIFIQNELPKMGITATVIDPADMDSLRRALDEHNVFLFFTESPTNPFLRCVDIELVSQLCHKKGTLVCIDSTFASPVNQKALTLGADIVLHSATKFIAGHNDVSPLLKDKFRTLTSAICEDMANFLLQVLGGCLSGSVELISKIRQYHHVIGGVINPNAAYMIIRGMKTLHLRVQHQNTTALRMAQFLEDHPKIIRVYYPGLPSHPEHQIAKRQMTGFGGVVSFEVDGDLRDTMKFINSLKIPYLAPSFGGTESIVDQPAIMSYWDLPASERAKYGIMDNLVRFSCGVEAFEDLKADIVQALEKI